MKFDVTYSQEYNCLMAKFVGDMTLESVKIYVKEVARMALIHNCKRLVNDLREANIKLSLGEIYNAPSKVIIGNFDRSWKRAILVKEKLDKMNFFETTSQNQGFKMKIFLELHEALEWLDK